MQIVIPAHAAYRTIRLHGQRGPTPWESIASCPDRAAGVQSIVLFDRSEEARYLPDRAPNIDALINITRHRSRERALKAETLAAATRALLVMPNVHNLVFSATLSGDTPACHAAEAAFWGAISSHGSLRHLEYSQAVGSPTLLPRYTTDVRMYPFWSISDLTSLSVRHAAFLRHPPSVIQFSRVLRSSPALESLSIEAQVPSFDLHALLHDVRFPRLRTLALALAVHPAHSDPAAGALAAFLERTPTLEHAAWRHIDPGPLSPRALPSLRSLRAEVPDSPGGAGRGLLLRGGAELAALGPVCIAPRTVDAMALMRREALCLLDVAAFESIAMLVRAVRLFPRLRWLRVPAVDYWYAYAPATPAPVHLGEWVQLLGSLPTLEVFRGVSIFRDPELIGPDDNDQRARDLINICPRLQRVEHWDLEPTREIALTREGNRASWRVEVVDNPDERFTWWT
ncbi:hypothetical protein F5148DRAFT_1327872 [Russula earlei]|uniref:Uncharacterized protein n=1 Tax=Russula earlei TaxID=71964 RepID=A0ACC0UH93_9AGAM|nr:hypothetical protein F5148DRAFT_1327872 [Russula earlei]